MTKCSQVLFSMRCVLGHICPPPATRQLLTDHTAVCHCNTRQLCARCGGGSTAGQDQPAPIGCDGTAAPGPGCREPGQLPSLSLWLSLSLPSLPFPFFCARLTCSSPGLKWMQEGNEPCQPGGSASAGSTAKSRRDVADTNPGCWETTLHQDKTESSGE